MNRYLVHKDIYNDILLKSFGLDAESIEKARGLPDGTIREWNGKKYKKIRGKWIPLAKGRKAREKEAIKPKRPAKEEVKTNSTGEITEKTKGSESKTIPIISIADNYEKNQEVEFKFGGNTLSGKITAKGSEGVTVHDKDGNKYRVNYNAITKTIKNSDGTIPSGSFNATDYKKAYWDDKATNTEDGIQHIYDSLGESGKEAQEKTKEIMDRVKLRMDTTGGSASEYTLDPDKKIYTKARRKLHRKIVKSYLSKKAIKNATPAPGEQPKYIIFGGRGGSGKSWFSNDAKAENGWDIKFDKSKFIYIDSDDIKGMLRPPYEGWNAGEVYEESSYLRNMIQKLAKKKGLNIIIDGTMSYYSTNGDSNWTRDEMLSFKNSGYRVESHYMFVPVQTSSARAIGRFANIDKRKDSPTFGKPDYKGRFVPLTALLSMQDNEKTFDSVKDICDDWSFSDNQGREPKLVSRKEK